MRKPKRLHLQAVARPVQHQLPRKLRKRLQYISSRLLAQFRFALNLMAEAAADLALQLAEFARQAKEFRIKWLMSSAMIMMPKPQILICGSC